MSGATHRDTRGGFTLLEVLASLVIASLVLVLLSTVLGAIKSLRRHAAMIENAGSELLSVTRLLDDLVIGAAPASAGDDQQFMSAVRLDLRTVPPAAAASRSRVMMRFSVERGPVNRSPRSLIVEWFDPLIGTNRREVVVKEAQRIEFDYFGGTGGSGPQWHPIWRNPVQLPEAIRLKIGYPDLGEPFELVFRTVLRAETACAADPSLPRCGGVR